MKGDRVGSTQLEFIPSQPVQAGRYTFDVAETVGTGSAGAVTLILQTILLPLALTTGESIVTLRGGTFIPWSPPASYIEQVYLPFVQQLGIQATVNLHTWGWYPRGGGELQLQITGNSGGVGSLERDPHPGAESLTTDSRVSDRNRTTFPYSSTNGQPSRKFVDTGATQSPGTTPARTGSRAGNGHFPDGGV